MIKFKILRYTNFLSTGASPTEVILDKSPSTLIVGKNGAGKSTFLDALSFALFGKSHRNINRPQLVNSVNGKNLMVEIEFRVGRDDFKVRRGLKPVVFEIFKNGKMYDQTANIKDYQKFLEDNILKLNYRSFHQVVVLGSSNFTPFMSLTASGRRAVVEDLLNIGVFGKMQVLLKADHAKAKEVLDDMHRELTLVDKKIAVQKTHIHELENINTDIVDAKEDEIIKLEDEIETLEIEHTRIAKLVGSALKEHAERHRKLTESHRALSDTMTSTLIEIKRLHTQGKFFTDNDECPSCEQKIDADVKAKHVLSCFTEESALKDTEKSLQGLIDKDYAQMSKLNNVHKDIQSEDRKRIALATQLAIKRSSVKAKRMDIKTLNAKTGDTSKAKHDLEILQDDRDMLQADRLEKTEATNYNILLMEMLKDSGIKSKIAKQYLPLMNQLINKYLSVMDFYVSFQLNESFTETIKSRHRDVFSYESFSEGEKSRIDLALLFTWRQIAKMKNSVSTNLLILDETFDSSLDSEGVDSLLKILQGVDEGTNIFVISHKGEVLENKFRSTITFKKVGNFSRIE